MQFVVGVIGLSAVVVFLVVMSICPPVLKDTTENRSYKAIMLCILSILLGLCLTQYLFRPNKEGVLCLGSVYYKVIEVKRVDTTTYVPLDTEKK